MPVWLKVMTGDYVLFTPKGARQAAERRLQHMGVPDWHNDPTYNMRKKK